MVKTRQPKTTAIARKKAIASQAKVKGKAKAGKGAKATENAEAVTDPIVVTTVNEDDDDDDDYEPVTPEVPKKKRGRPKKTAGIAAVVTPKRKKAPPPGPPVTPAEITRDEVQKERQKGENPYGKIYAVVYNTGDIEEKDSASEAYAVVMHMDDRSREIFGAEVNFFEGRDELEKCKLEKSKKIPFAKKIAAESYPIVKRPIPPQVSKPVAKRSKGPIANASTLPDVSKSVTKRVKGPVSVGSVQGAPDVPTILPTKQMGMPKIGYMGSKNDATNLHAQHLAVATKMSVGLTITTPGAGFNRNKGPLQYGSQQKSNPLLQHIDFGPPKFDIICTMFDNLPANAEAQVIGIEIIENYQSTDAHKLEHPYWLYRPEHFVKVFQADTRRDVKELDDFWHQSMAGNKHNVQGKVDEFVKYSVGKDKRQMTWQFLYTWVPMAFSEAEVKDCLHKAFVLFGTATDSQDAYKTCVFAQNSNQNMRSNLEANSQFYKNLVDAKITVQHCRGLHGYFVIDDVKTVLCATIPNVDKAKLLDWQISDETNLYAFGQ